MFDKPAYEVFINPFEKDLEYDTRFPSTFLFNSKTNMSLVGLNESGFNLLNSYSMHNWLLMLNNDLPMSYKAIVEEEIGNVLGKQILNKDQTEDGSLYTGGLMLVKTGRKDWSFSFCDRGILSVFHFFKGRHIFSNPFIRTCSKFLRNYEGRTEDEEFENYLIEKTSRKPTKMRQSDFEEPITAEELEKYHSVFDSYYF